MRETKPKRIVVMTGATTGLGACAVKQIVSQPDTKVIIGARGSGRSGPEGSQVLPLDLGLLSSLTSCYAPLQ